jgi:N6-adenosine-specific RNA methylase IME4
MTGYQIYKKQAEVLKKTNESDYLFPTLPCKKYQVIYADPPWYYNGKLQFDKTSKDKENIDLTKPIFISSAEFKYPTVKTEDLKKLNVASIADDDCLLFMWTTNPHLAQAVELGEAWGFEYKTVAFIWDKLNHNPGQYTLSNCELCLVFKKGRIPRPRGARNIQQLVRVPRTTHSAKPIEVLERINKMFPEQTKIELFARSKNIGWDTWGLDAEIPNQAEQIRIDFSLDKVLVSR